MPNAIYTERDPQGLEVTLIHAKAPSGVVSWIAVSKEYIVRGKFIESDMAVLTRYIVEHGRPSKVNTFKRILNPAEVAATLSSIFSPTRKS